MGTLPHPWEVHVEYIFITVIDLSGVQFGLKSYARFQNQMSMQGEFYLKSQA